MVDEASDHPLWMTRAGLMDGGHHPVGDDDYHCDPASKPISPAGSHTTSGIAIASNHPVGMIRAGLIDGGLHLMRDDDCNCDPAGLIVGRWG